MKRSLFAAVCALLSAASVRAGVDLVRDGKPLADIVIRADAPSGILRAAEDLQQHLVRMSGATLPIVTAPSPEVERHAYVGESEFTRALGFALGAFDNSGFRIVARDGHVILAGVDLQRQPSPYSVPGEGLKKWQALCGEAFNYGRGGEGSGAFNRELDLWTNDDLGSWYAVAELLEQLGVRWYMPYEDGTVIPETPTVTVAEQDLRREAAFARREFCYYGAMRDDAEGIRWFKRMKLGNHTIIVYNHTTDDIFGPAEQKEKHPEYLACDADGKPYGGYPDGHGMPRFSHPAFRRAAANYMNHRLAAVPELTAITIGPPDGGVKLDARDLPLYGTPEDTVAQKASNAMWDFHVFLAGELKKAHPGKFLLYMTGAGANLFPTNIETFPDNLMIPWGCNSANMVLEAGFRAELAECERWFSVMREKGVANPPRGPTWDYFLYYRTPDRPRYPVMFTAALQRQMQAFRPYTDGKFIEIQPERYKVEINGREHQRSRLGVRGLVHLMVYWQSRLFWDPDTDRQALLDEYYRLFFGPAEAGMKAFHEFAEACWNRQESRSLTEHTGFLKEPDVERFFALLADASARAGEGSVYDRRIAQIESEMQSLKKLFPSLKRTGPELEARIAAQPVTIDGDLSEHPADGWIPMCDIRTGEPIADNPTRVTVAFSPDKSALLIAVECREALMGQLKADCTARDDFSIFQDDVVEVYINTPRRSYFKIAVNPNNALWTESTDVFIIDRDTLPILWNPAVESAVRRADDRWTVELRIPTDDFGDLGPSREHTWGLQIGRTRFTGGADSAQAIAPTFGGPYRTLNKWASLRLP
jgi:hypothetical protein